MSTTTAKKLPHLVQAEDEDDRELEARYLEARVIRIANTLNSLDDLIDWAEKHDQEKAASETRQLAARWRSISSDLVNEARGIRAHMQG